tara:strand:- start:3 stop:590 length:588 start_codon:yes stop_codon:yes gene_type:complete
MFINEKFFILSIFIVSTIAVIEFITLSSKIFKNRNIINLSSILFFSSYILFISSFLIYLVAISKLKILVFILLLICVFSDIGGILTGKIFKGPKLIKVSPNKTVSGSVGSFLFAVAMSITLVFFSTSIFNFYSIILGLAISLGVQVGDLFFSFLKRKAKVKDTGNLLPGHGGILDRIDGILFGIPVGFITLIIIH